MSVILKKTALPGEALTRRPGDPIRGETFTSAYLHETAMPIPEKCSDIHRGYSCTADYDSVPGFPLPADTG